MPRRPPIPQHTAEQLHAFRVFYDALAPGKEQIDREVREAALRVPVFAALAEGHDVDADETQRELSGRLEREALVDQQWEPYLENLAAQAALYAQLGVDFGDWYTLLAPYRAFIHDKILSPGAAEPRAVLAGMDRFLDIVMSTLASAYLETKAALVRKAESELGLYIDLFQNASVGMLVYDWTEPPDRGSFRLVAANPAAAQLGTPQVLGHIGRTIRDTNPELLDQQVIEHYAAAVERRESREWILEHGPADARQIYEVRCFPLQSRYIGVLFENATLRHRLSAQLERHVQELQRSNRELDDFAYIASHDLKAPLRDIDNLAKWIVEDAHAVLPEPSQRHLSVLQDRIGRMERLLDDLLEYSRAGRTSVPSEEFFTSSVIDEVLRLIAPKEGFEVVVSGDRPAVCTPRVPFAVLLRNLISNAIKHHHRERGRVVVDVADGPERIRVSVIDDGPGIPPEFHDRVFRMFQTLRPRDQVEGSGVGLAIVKKLVEIHGGAVWIESKPGAGAILRFTWPKTWPAVSKGPPS